MRFIAAVVLLTTISLVALAQRPRTIDTSTEKTAAPKVPPAPQTFKAKYEGGVFGHNRTMDGTLSFDDANRRLLFRNKQQKEVLFVPYDAVASAFADSHRRQPAAATVASQIPLIYAIPARFIKTKVRYLTIQYLDPATKVSGITSFKLENKEILASVLKTLGEKAGMETRGDIYIKKKDAVSKMNP
jgi:hypothetical protein